MFIFDYVVPIYSYRKKLNKKLMLYDAVIVTLFVVLPYTTKIHELPPHVLYIRNSDVLYIMCSFNLKYNCKVVSTKGIQYL